MSTQSTKQTELKEINVLLFNALIALLKAHPNGREDNKPFTNVNFSEKDYSYINDDTDLIEVKYFGNMPDGDLQAEYYKELMKKEKGILITDVEAFEILSTRLNNTTLHL